MGKLHLYRRKDESPHWHAQVYVGGKRYRFTCHTTDKATAREYARKRAKELEKRHNRGLVGLPEPVRMSQVFERYEREYAERLRPGSRERMLQVVKQARRWFADGPLHDPLVANVSVSDIQAFLDAKQHEGVSARTVNLYRANLHRVFHLCVRPWLLIASNAVAATEPLRQELREPRLLTDAEYECLRLACAGEPMLLLFVTLAWQTGARTSELLQLEWAPFVFKHLRRSGDAEPGQRIERVYRGFKSAAKRAELADLRPHDLRHSFVTRKLAEGVPVQLVSKYVGHADLATTLRYTHLVPEHLRAVVAEPDATLVRERSDIRQGSAR